MWKHIAANALTLGVVLVAAVAIAVQLGKGEWAGPGPLEEARFFEVPRGASLRAVSRQLAEEGIVSSDAIFRVGAEYTERGRDLKFGTYEIPPGATMPEVLDILTSGGPSVFPYTVTALLRARGPELRVRERVPGEAVPVEVATFDPTAEETPEAYRALVESGEPITWRVAVPPGLTSWEIATGLEALDFLEGTIEGTPPEGMLAPDTYEVSKGSDRAALIAQMREAQERVLAEEWADRAPGVPYTTPEEALIMASIVEKETGVASERDVVAAVFTNRLERGMRLQTDPTVIYGVTNGEGGPLGRGLRRSELDRPTPYNTYQIDGLPPGPIANPGREAIRAALNPAETEFVYFVADGTGGHAFAETLDEHNRNVAAWRRIEAEAASSN
ncbi:endolytic transglycosylase MltG [Jannaschia sp. W003]|uniref:endolytic transglycosylase MltG n=1 Tax=Jannaschia sp. W003 TaxID=2867012 RepID=UPI0021A534B8|nr:endolytic transglycosylase MltG [Jannaschia sp. W003]UWQ21014.1 endolytic transglycosylase MltG [Jannaschia sp. W003]